MKKIGNYLYNPKHIGKGSFSKVYKGYHIDNEDKIVAIKKIFISNIKIRKYIEQEINVMKKINHENILKLYDVEYGAEFIYLILEYCEHDLYNYLKKNNINYEEIRYFMSQLLNGLKYMMDKEIVHRDLKPQNILITKDNILKICDFGFAREFKEENMSSTFCGSPLYMAPEIIDRNEYNIKSDIWSVGIILYEMCMKFHPFKSDNIKELLEKIKNKKIEIYFNEDMPLKCKKLLKKLLKINTQKRITWKELFENEWINNIKNNNDEDESKDEDENDDDDDEEKIIINSTNKIEINNFDDSYEIFSLDLDEDLKKKDNDYIVVNYDEVEKNNNLKEIMNNSMSILKKFLDI